MYGGVIFLFSKKFSTESNSILKTLLHSKSLGLITKYSFEKLDPLNGFPSTINFNVVELSLVGYK